MSEEQPGTGQAHISCNICRLRKVKCPAEKPMCQNCVRRGEDCSYDTVVKRRGPDKLPGGRLKSSTRRSQVVEIIHSPGTRYHRGAGSLPAPSSSTPIAPSQAQARRERDRGLPYALNRVRLSEHPVAPTSRNETLHHAPFAVPEQTPLYLPPGCLDDAREGWWIWTMSIFSPFKERAREMIHAQCRAFFQRQHIWFTYLNRATFYRSLYGSDPSIPLSPHLVLAMLACQTFVGEGRTQLGQFKAFRFADSARMIIDYYLIAGSKDPTLAAAALLLVDLELEPHVLHSEPRCKGSFEYLDAVSTAVLEPTLDQDHPQVSSNPVEADFPPVTPASGQEVEQDIVPRFKGWAATPQWNDTWSLGEIRKEEMRRMCWTVASKTTAWMIFRDIIGLESVKLSMFSSHSYSLLFPGEASLIQKGQGALGKTTIWALYCRVLAIWHFIATRQVTPEERTAVLKQVAMIEQGLMIHSQRGHTEYVWQTADTVLAVRGKLEATIPAYTPIWFARQKAVMAKFALSLADPTLPGPSVIDKPVFGWWYLVQARIAERSAIGVAVNDESAWGDADEILRMVYQAEDAVLAVWPCPYLETFVRALPKMRDEAFAASRGRARGSVAWRF